MPLALLLPTLDDRDRRTLLLHNHASHQLRHRPNNPPQNSYPDRL
jgi:hypothetical protein